MNLDLPAWELAPGVWSDASNMRFRNGLATKRKGTTAAYTTPTAVPYCLFPFTTATARFLMQFGTATVYVDDGTTRTNITGAAVFTGARDDRWTVRDFNGVAVFNNGVDSPYYWNGNTASSIAALTNWTAGMKADAIWSFKNYLGGIAVTKSGTKYPYRILWGDAAEPGSLPTSYTAAATNKAGEQDLTGIGTLIDALPLGDALIVYGQKGRYAVRYIGGDDVFSFQQLPGEDGLLTRGCVVNTPKGHVFLTNGDVRIHQGGESVSIADGLVRKWMTQNMDSTNAVRAFLCLNPQEDEVWVCFPATNSSDCDTVLAWNWNAPAADAWSKFTAPNLTYGVAGLISSTLAATTYASLAATVTYETITSTYSQNEAASNEARLIVSTSTPTIGLANTGSLDFGSRVSCYLEKSGISLSETADEIKPLSRLRPALDATAGAQVTVKLATTIHPDQTPTFSSSTTFTQGTTQWANQFTTAGRYGAVRIEGADDQIWSIKTYRIEVPEARARF